MSNDRSNTVWTLIKSDRVSARTRAVLQARAEPDDPAYQPAALKPDTYGCLRAVLDRVLPQSGIDLAQRLDRALASGDGDGWRFADLPPDVEAWCAGLAALDSATGGGFALLDGTAQDALLAKMAAGALYVAGGPATTALQHWFEDLRGEAVKLYVAYPATYARIGYSGFAYGGDGPRKGGFHAIGPGERESWEPLADDSL